VVKKFVNLEEDLQNCPFSPEWNSPPGTV